MFFRQGVLVLAALLFVVRCICGAVIASEASGRPEPGAVLSASALEDDLDFMMQTLEEVHPNLYAYTKQSVIQQQVASLRADMRRPMTMRAFGLRASQIVAAFKDGHTRVELLHDNTGTGLCFPLNLRKEGDRIVAVATYGDAIHVPMGSELLSINGRPMRQVWEEFGSTMSAEREAYRDLIVSRQLPIDLWTICQLDSPYSLELKAPGAQQSTRLLVHGISYEALRHAAGCEAEAPPFEFEVLRDEKVGLLHFRSFEDLGKFIPFVKTMFTTIKASGVSDMIIDLRENGGGVSILGDELLKYLADRPFRTNERVETRVSRQIIEWWEHGIFERFTFDEETKRAIAEEAKELKAQRMGGLRVSEGETRQPAPNPLRFGGRLWVLIGLRTFSSASDFAAVIKDMKLGTLVGEETGGLASCYGDSYPFELPNTRIEVEVSHKYFVRSGGFDDGHGVLPDYEARETPTDTTRGEDAVLVRTLQLIRTRAQHPPQRIP